MNDYILQVNVCICSLFTYHTPPVDVVDIYKCNDAIIFLKIYLFNRYLNDYFGVLYMYKLRNLSSGSHFSHSCHVILSLFAF